MTEPMRIRFDNTKKRTTSRILRSVTPNYHWPTPSVYSLNPSGLLSVTTGAFLGKVLAPSMSVGTSILCKPNSRYDPYS